MSKYTYKSTFGVISLNDIDWDRFKKDIQSNCHFQVWLGQEQWPVTKARQISRSCLPFRYYDKGVMRYYHVSNDDRRKIVSYLETVGQISRH